MVGMIAAGIAAQAVGGLFGGRGKKKAAKKMLAKIEKATDQGIAQIDSDQARAIQYRADDEARMKAATGYDLVKLRDDAEKAGFNPLTVLQTTGGAGYDGRGAVITTPFIGKADGFFQKASILAGGPTQAVVDASGYVGDTIAGVGGSILGVGQQQLQQQHELTMQRNELLSRGSPGAVAGTFVAGGRKGRAAPLVGARRMTASPISQPDGQGLRSRADPQPLYHDVQLYSPGGRLISVDASWARRNGFEPYDRLAPGDWENYLGESGQALSLGDSVRVYQQEGRGRFGADPLASDLPGLGGGNPGGIAPKDRYPFQSPPSAVEWRWPLWWSKPGGLSDQ